MNNLRKKEAWDKRDEANILANERPIVEHLSNGDEQKFRKEIKGKDKPIYLVSFTKGLPHDENTGLIKDPQHFQYFVKAIDSGDPRDFRDTPLGPDAHCGSADNCPPPKKWKSAIATKGVLDATASTSGKKVGLRAWESQSAGLVFELEGFDAQAVTMPPHPVLGSPELTAEMAEVYAQAYLRDTPFTALSAGVIKYSQTKAAKTKTKSLDKLRLKALKAKEADVEKYLKMTNELKKLKWFSGQALDLNEQEKARRKNRLQPTPSNAFRGITKGDELGPYLSQFLLIGSKGVNRNDRERKIEDGKISFGAISIDQKVRVASPRNYMTTWDEWLDVQNAAKVDGLEEFVNVKDKERRFMFTPRDLATYVHYDALYEAYFNACLILLGRGVAFDPGIPYQEDDTRDHQQGFAHFGGPHILTLVTEVATRALKAVRFQKYNVHRRCRPEVLAARITKAKELSGITKGFVNMRNTIGTKKDSILDLINRRNKRRYEFDPEPSDEIISADENYLLPMAFTEGSPMHPSYGAGHATVAGACITVLKAFFDCNSKFKPNGTVANKAYVATNDGTTLELVPVFDQSGNKAELTVEGELNKLASNISIGRNWAGVHYFTDYYESLLMGEKIAIGILEEQKLLFKETFSMTIPLFGGKTIRI